MPKEINLETLAGGAFAERARQAIKEVMDNIADPNTPWKNKRKATLELTFATMEDREIIECDVIAKVKLAPRLSVHTKFLLDKDMDGEIIASEFKNQVPGQQVMKVDSDTGEIIEDKVNSSNLEGLKVVK